MPTAGQRYYRIEGNFEGEVQTVEVTDVFPEEWGYDGMLLSEGHTNFLDIALGIHLSMATWMFNQRFRAVVA